jgi:hypothetical protein
MQMYLPANGLTALKILRSRWQRCFMSEFVKLKSVEAYPDHTLHLTFASGEKRVYDLKPDLVCKIFSPLKNVGLFLQAKNDVYGVVWTDSIDIAAEHLYYNGIPVA